jgi:alcohol dehydrogenase (NADP+)
MADSQPRLTLRDGRLMPAVGLGTWRADPAAVAAAVRSALRLGVRHIDCAAIYGNEAEVGSALAQACADGVVNREAVWVTSKLWNDSHAPDRVRSALERTLRDLRLDHLDLYLIHWPVAHRAGVALPSRGIDQLSLEQMPLADTWAAMEALVEAGLVRSIGVSNCSVAKLSGLAAAARIPPAVNQVERHPWLQQQDLLEHCRATGTVLTAYAPLGSGATVDGTGLLQDPAITAIARRHGATAAQVLLAWGLACGTAVIPKSVHPDRIAENLASVSLQLDPGDMASIAALERHHRFIDGSFWVLPDGPYTLAGLWDETPAASC